MWDETRKAAWSKAQLFAVAACRVAEVPPARMAEIAALSDQLLAQVAATADPSYLSQEVTSPLVGVVDDTGPQRQVILLSGWVALSAAHRLGASVPVYPLPKEAVAGLTDAALYDPKGFLLDRPKAVAWLVSHNFTIAAELLGDKTDPIDVVP